MGLGSEIRKKHSGSWIPGSKRHRIPDPQLCKNVVLSLILTFLQAAVAAVCIPHSDRWCAGAAVGKHYPKQISN